MEKTKITVTQECPHNGLSLHARKNIVRSYNLAGDGNRHKSQWGILAVGHFCMEFAAIGSYCLDLESIFPSARSSIARTGQYITRCPTNNLNTPKKLPFPIACCLALEWKDSLTQRLLHGRAVIRILSSSKRYFQYEKIKSVSPSGHVIFCLFYRYRLNFHIKNFLIHFRNSQNSHVSQNVTYRNILTREIYICY